MSYVKAMLDTHPREFGLDADQLTARIDACLDCAQACTACADACLGEADVAAMVRCIRIDSDCADVCAATARVLSRQTEYAPEITRAVVGACLVACRECAQECEAHGAHGVEHCRVCAEACRRCEAACEAILSAVS